MRRGQIQSLEPVIVVIMLILIFVVAGIYFFRASAAQDAQNTATFQSAEDLALLQRLATLPELSCPASVSTGTACLDGGKIYALQKLLEDPQSRVYYFPLFGNTNLTIETVGIEGPGAKINLYDASKAGTTTRATVAYFTLYDPKDGSVSLAVLNIRRSVG